MTQPAYIETPSRTPVNATYRTSKPVELSLVDRLQADARGVAIAARPLYERTMMGPRGPEVVECVTRENYGFT